MANLTMSFNFTPDPPRLPWQRHLGQNWYNSVCVRDICKIFASIGGFRGWTIECCQSHFPPTDPRCHGNEIWSKMSYNSACVRDICEIFASIGGGFQRKAIECCYSHFPLTDPRCHGNKICDKMGYNSACVRDICEIFCVYRGVGDGPLNGANHVFPQPTPVAMATKSKTKWAITRSV